MPISIVDEESRHLDDTYLEIGLQNIALAITPQHPAVEPQDANVKAPSRKSSVSSSNLSTSRHTLRSPLPGRPKTPVEQAVANAGAKNVRGSSDPIDVVKPGDEEARMLCFLLLLALLLTHAV